MHTDPAPNDRLLSTKEVAAILGVTDRCLEAKRLAGRGPRHYKLDHLVRYRPADVRRWIESNARNPAARAA